MKAEGGCHCGAIAFEAVVDPERVAICHCTDCQQLSGTAYRTVVPAAPTAFRLVTGELRKYVKTAESGARRVHAFCADCGTSIYSSAADNPQELRAIGRAWAVRPRSPQISAGRSGSADGP